MLNSFQTSGNSPGGVARYRGWYKPVSPQHFQPIFTSAALNIPVVASLGFFNIDSVIVQFPEAV